LSLRSHCQWRLGACRPQPRPRRPQAGGLQPHWQAAVGVHVPPLAGAGPAIFVGCSSWARGHSSYEVEDVDGGRGRGRGREGGGGWTWSKRASRFIGRYFKKKGAAAHTCPARSLTGRAPAVPPFASTSCRQTEGLTSSWSGGRHRPCCGPAGLCQWYGPADTVDAAAWGWRSPSRSPPRSPTRTPRRT
jgi:hypothetical protein